MNKESRIFLRGGKGVTNPKLSDHDPFEILKRQDRREGNGNGDASANGRYNRETDRPTRKKRLYTSTAAATKRQHSPATLLRLRLRPLSRGAAGGSWIAELSIAAAAAAAAVEEGRQTVCRCSIARFLLSVSQVLSASAIGHHQLKA